MTSKVSTVLGPQELPNLPVLDVKTAKASTSAAVKRIQSDADVLSWQKSEAYQTIVLFLARLCESAVGKATVVWTSSGKGKEKASFEESTSPIDAVLGLLSELQRWTKEIEPLKTPQRFGNLAFRTWGQRLEERVQVLHEELLPPHMHPLIAELQEYLLGAFGSWIRLDYGSGHELSFLAWLCFLYRIGALAPKDQDGPTDASTIEEKIAIEVIPKYLEVVWGLQDRYGLEPAGSHGVWGLDDYQFIPYAIGAAQLRNQSSYLPHSTAAASHKPDPLKMPIDELLRFIPKTESRSTTSSSSSGSPPFANLYTTSIARIHSLKRGPFVEHSPILYDVSVSVPNWVKVHGGMMKMWEAECLGKRPVVQHFPFGGSCFVWEGGEHRVATAEGGESVTAAKIAMTPTAAPWKLESQSGMPMPPTAAPWKTNGTAATPMLPATGAPWKQQNPSMIPATGAPWKSTNTMASTGSSAAASSPFGIIPRPSVPSRSRKD